MEESWPRLPWHFFPSFPPLCLSHPKPNGAVVTQQPPAARQGWQQLFHPHLHPHSHPQPHPHPHPHHLCSGTLPCHLLQQGSSWKTQGIFALAQTPLVARSDSPCWGQAAMEDVSFAVFVFWFCSADSSELSLAMNAPSPSCLGSCTQSSAAGQPCAAAHTERASWHAAAHAQLGSRHVQFH